MSLQNFQEILDTPRDPKPVAPEPVDEFMTLQFEEVSFQHHSATTLALNGISFSAARGDTIAFVGPSGAGKTTLVKLLVGLYRAEDRARFFTTEFPPPVSISTCCAKKSASLPRTRNCSPDRSARICFS